MSLKISVNSKNEAERLICILNVGITTCLQEGLISIEEAENYLYSLHSMDILKDAGLDSNVIDLIHLGSELENVERIIPDELEKSVEEIGQKSKSALKDLPRPELPVKKWIDAK